MVIILIILIKLIILIYLKNNISKINTNVDKKNSIGQRDIFKLEKKHWILNAFSSFIIMINMAHNIGYKGSAIWKKILFFFSALIRSGKWDKHAIEMQWNSLPSEMLLWWCLLWFHCSLSVSTLRHGFVALIINIDIQPSIHKLASINGLMYCQKLWKIKCCM